MKNIIGYSRFMVNESSEINMDVIRLRNAVVDDIEEILTRNGLTTVVTDYDSSKTNKDRPLESLDTVLIEVDRPDIIHSTKDGIKWNDTNNQLRQFALINCQAYKRHLNFVEPWLKSMETGEPIGPRIWILPESESLIDVNGSEMELATRYNSEKYDEFLEAVSNEAKRIGPKIKRIKTTRALFGR